MPEERWEVDGQAEVEVEVEEATTWRGEWFRKCY